MESLYYTFFIAGYSQGAQTTISVLREISERHPEIHVTRAFAGGGVYDLNTTYDAIVDRGTKMPSTVCNLLWSYNHYYGLGYDVHDYLKDPVASNFDDWFLSKKYKRKALDDLIKAQTVSDLCTDAILDTSSPLARRFREAFSRETLTSGWTPRSDFDVLLMHNELDDVVPVENFYALAQFLKDNGVKVETASAKYQSDMPTGHEEGGVRFMTYLFFQIFFRYNENK